MAWVSALGVVLVLVGGGVHSRLRVTGMGVSVEGGRLLGL